MFRKNPRSALKAEYFALRVLTEVLLNAIQDSLRILKLIATNSAAMLFLIGFSAGVAEASSKSPSYPQVLEVKGQVSALNKDSKANSLKARDVLREKAHIKVVGAGQIKIQLDPVRQIVLLSDSELLIPAISWDSGEAPVLNLKKGSLRWTQQEGLKSPYNVALTSALFQFVAPAGDYVVEIQPEAALTSLKVYQGQLIFAALNAEESVTVRSGQQVQFLGVLEEGEIAYDILLHGKRIPKGKLSAVTKIDVSELSRFEKEEKGQARQDSIANAVES